jgi:hypothetical protein
MAYIGIWMFHLEKTKVEQEKTMRLKTWQHLGKYLYKHSNKWMTNLASKAGEEK